MIRWRESHESVIGRGVQQAVGAVVALSVAALIGAWLWGSFNASGNNGPTWAWLTLILLILAVSAWLFWAVGVYRRRLAQLVSQPHRLVDLLDACYWQTDAHGALVQWRVPRDTTHPHWDLADAQGRLLWDAWTAAEPSAEAGPATRMRAGAVLRDVPVQRTGSPDATIWLMRAVPRYDFLGRFAGYEGTLKPQAAPAATPPVDRNTARASDGADRASAQAAAARSALQAALDAFAAPAVLLEIPPGADRGRVAGLNAPARALFGVESVVWPTNESDAVPLQMAELWARVGDAPLAKLQVTFADAWDELMLRLRARDAQPDVHIEVERSILAFGLRLMATPRRTAIGTASHRVPAETAVSEWAVLSIEVGSRSASEAALEDQEALMYAVSHDLRAPLRVVEGFTRIVKEDYGRVLDRIGNDHLDRVLGASARMSGMIDALLEQAKLSTRPLHRESVNLAQMAALIIEDLRRQAPQREVETVVEDGMTAYGDPLLLRMVLENLLGNAFKYSAKRPRARIEFLRLPQPGKAGLWAYCVRDNGVGFDMRYAGRLFGMFQRLHSANDYQGTGVGLASVRRVVHRHGGRIWAESEVDVGTRIYFTLGESEDVQDAPNC